MMRRSAPCTANIGKKRRKSTFGFLPCDPPGRGGDTPLFNCSQERSRWLRTTRRYLTVPQSLNECNRGLVNRGSPLRNLSTCQVTSKENSVAGV
jgi:hypothetical protein